MYPADSWNTRHLSQSFTGATSKNRAVLQAGFSPLIFGGAPPSTYSPSEDFSQSDDSNLCSEGSIIYNITPIKEIVKVSIDIMPISNYRLV